MNKRALITVIILLLVLTAPYFVYLPILLAGIILVPFYFEAIPLGFLVDALYGPYTQVGLSLSFPVAITCLIIVLILLPVREQFRFYNV